MLRFKQYLIEGLDDGDGSYASSSRLKAPSGAVGKRLKQSSQKIGSEIKDYATEVGQGIASDPMMFAKEYGKSLFTDPDTYHSGLAAAGMVPGVGELADLADAGLYAAQGDKEGVKASLASTVPLLGMIPAVGRIANTGKNLAGQKARDVADMMRSQAKEWQKNPEGLEKFSRSLEDPFYGMLMARVSTPNIKQIEDFELLGAVVPDIDTPQATLSWGELLQGIYGKNAEKYAKLATRGQRRLVDPSFNPNNISSYMFPSYSKDALERPIDIYLGTNPAIFRSKPEAQYSPIMPPSMIAAYANANRGRNLGNQISVPINLNISTDPKTITIGTMAHEAGHGIAATDPQFKFGEISLQSQNSPNPSQKFEELWDIESTSNPKLRQVFGDVVPQTNITGLEADLGNMDQSWRVPAGTAMDIVKSQTPMDLKPKTQSALQKAYRERNFLNITDPQIFPRVRQNIINSADRSVKATMDYLSNRELPSQIGDAKEWMFSKGYPHVDVNMPAEEAARLSKEIIEKWKKGFFRDAGGRTMQIIDMLADPKGKAFWDTIAKKNKGSTVTDRLKQIEMA